MHRTITPANSPVSSPAKDFPLPHGVSHGVLRIGGGFTTDSVAHAAAAQADALAQQYRHLDGGMFNAALANHVEDKTRIAQEAHAFLLSRPNVDKVGVQYYENTTAARPPVTYSQLYGGAEVSNAAPREMHGSDGEHRPLWTTPGAFAAEDSVLSLDRPTVSTLNKTRLARDHAATTHHHQSAMSLHAHEHNSPSRSRMHKSSSAAASRLGKTCPTPHVDHTLHSIDGSCCNYNHPERHAKIQGLFVTFCENNVETKLFNAVRDLEIERGNREMDSKVHRQQVAAYLRQIEDLSKANGDLERLASELKVSHSTESTDLKTLKEEYEAKYRSRTAEWEALMKEHTAVKARAEDLANTAGARQNRIDELENELRGARTMQLVSDRQMKEMQDRLNAAVSQAAVASDAREKMYVESRDLKVLLAAKEQIIDGLQQALREAEAKISGIAILREQVRGANRRK